MTLRKQNGKERPLAGAKIACCTHITAQTAVSKTVVTCKIKHLQKCFRDVDVKCCKMFYFTCNHLLSSTCVQHVKTFAKKMF